MSKNTESSIEKALQDLQGGVPAQPASTHPAAPAEAGTPGVPPDGSPPEGNASTPPANSPEVPPAPDVFNLKETFGDRFKSLDDLRTVVTGYETLLTEKSALSQRMKDLENDIVTLKTTNPYEDEDLYRLSKVKKEKPDEFPVLTKLLYGNPEPIELLKLDFVQKQPQYKDDPAFVDEYVRNNPRYKDMFSGEYEPTDSAYRIAKANLEMDSSQVRNAMVGTLKSIEVPAPPSKEAIEQQAQAELAAHVETWKPAFTELRNSFSKIPITIPSEDSPTEMVTVTDYDIPEDIREEVFQETAEMILKAGIPLTDENKAFVRDYMEHKVFMKNRTAIITRIVDEVMKKQDSNWRKKIHVPPGTQTNQGHPGAGTRKKSDATFDRLIQTEGLV